MENDKPMRTYGTIYQDGRKELTSIVLDDEGNPRVDTLKPIGAGDDWVPPTLVPLVKIAQPEFDAATHTAEPKIVWFDDRVERQWEVIPLPASVVAARARAAQRSAMAAQWAALPAWIRGPFADKYAAANLLIDAGDDEAAAALIQYATAPAGYTAEQAEVFAGVKATFAAAIASLPKP